MKFGRLVLFLVIFCGFSHAGVYIQGDFFSVYSFNNFYGKLKKQSFWSRSYINWGRVILSSRKGLRLNFNREGTGYISIKTGSVKKILDGLPLLKFKIAYKF